MCFEQQQRPLQRLLRFQRQLQYQPKSPQAALTSRTGSFRRSVFLHCLFLRLCLSFRPAQLLTTRLRDDWRGAPASRKRRHAILDTSSRRCIVRIVARSGATCIPAIGEFTRFGQFDGLVCRSNGCDTVLKCWLRFIWWCWRRSRRDTLGRRPRSCRDGRRRGWGGRYRRGRRCGRRRWRRRLSRRRWSSGSRGRCSRSPAAEG